ERVGAPRGGLCRAGCIAAEVAGVQSRPPLLEQPAVGDFVGQRVLEGILKIRKQPGLVDELSSLQAVESAAECIFTQLGDRLEQSQWHVLADDGHRLKQALVLRGESIGALREQGLSGRRSADRLDRLRQAVSSVRAGQDVRLRQGPDGLLEKEWVSAPDEELLERRQPQVPAKHGVQQLPSARSRKCI